MFVKKFLKKHADNLVMICMSIIQTFFIFDLMEQKAINVISSRELFFLFLASCFFSFMIIKLWMGFYEGVEQKAETFIILLLFTITSLVFAFLVDDIFAMDNRIEQAKIIAVILAGAIGLFGFTVAYLNYRRKSGLSIECIVQVMPEEKEVAFHFFNLKDKTSVVFEFMLVVRNIEIHYRLQQPMVLSSYGTGVSYIKMDDYFFTYVDADGKNISRGIIRTEDMELGFPVDLLSDLQARKVGIRAKTNQGLFYIEVKELTDLFFKKKIQLTQIVRDNDPLLSHSSDKNKKMKSTKCQEQDSYSLLLDTNEKHISYTLNKK